MSGLLHEQIYPVKAFKVSSNIQAGYLRFRNGYRPGTACCSLVEQPDFITGDIKKTMILSKRSLSRHSLPIT
jgi:hypothetical protein